MKNMWKLFAVGSMLVAAMAMVGCGDDKKPEPAKKILNLLQQLLKRRNLLNYILMNN